MIYYINTFLIYSIFGFIIETTLKTFFMPGMNNGILYGPWIPVYGFGTVLIIIIMRTVFNRVKAPRFIKILLMFVLVGIILSLLEYLGGVLIQIIFNKKFWNYSHFKYNLGPYISLEMSLVWTVFSFILVYIIKPKVDKLIKKIPLPVTVLVSVIFLIDIFITVLTK